MARRKTWFFSYVNETYHCVRQKYFYSAVLSLLVLSVGGEYCPLSCTCIHNTATMTCLDSYELEVPMDVSQWIHTLTLRGNNVSTLPEGAFSSNGTDLDLIALHLSGNNIQVIEAFAFSGLPRLHLLDLSHNKLTAVSDEAFSGLGELRYLYLNNTLTPSGTRQLPGALCSESLSNLQRLELSGNRLKTIPVSDFEYFNLNALILTDNSIETLGKNNISSLNDFKKIRVYLSLNPFKCNCELETFYHWLKNASQCPDSGRLICAQPEGRRGTPVEKLSREDVDCINAELEAVSYVFLGIVLALIGVVFLMVLYLNRGGMKRWLNNIREACRDQMEVYHYRYEQDSDPRLANVAV